MLGLLITALLYLEESLASRDSRVLQLILAVISSMDLCLQYGH